MNLFNTTMETSNLSAKYQAVETYGDIFDYRKYDPTTAREAALKKLLDGGASGHLMDLIIASDANTVCNLSVPRVYPYANIYLRPSLA